MGITSNPMLRKAFIVGTAAVAVLAGTTGPAVANAPGAGALTGFEYAPVDQELIMPSLLCANFNASSGDPLRIEMDLTGTFHGGAGSGAATFVRTAPYQANPEGSYAPGSNGEPCAEQTALSGTMSLSFTAGGTTYSCTDDGASTYERRGTTAITLTYSGTCNGVATNVVFTGGQEPCPPTGCLVDDFSSVVEGVYEQDAV